MAPFCLKKALPILSQAMYEATVWLQ